MALSLKQIKLLQKLAAAGEKGEWAGVDPRTVNMLQKRYMVSISQHPARSDLKVYHITPKGLSFLAVLPDELTQSAEAQPEVATPESAGYTMTEIDAKYFPNLEPEPEPESITTAAPGLGKQEAIPNSAETWTDAELDAYDEHEPFPPARPGELLVPPEIVSYQYEVAALKRKLKLAGEERDKLLKSEQHYHEDKARLIDALADLYAMASEAPKTWAADTFRTEIHVRVADVLMKIAPEALPVEPEDTLIDTMLNSEVEP